MLFKGLDYSLDYEFTLAINAGGLVQFDVTPFCAPINVPSLSIQAMKERVKPVANGVNVT